MLPSNPGVMMSFSVWCVGGGLDAFLDEFYVVVNRYAAAAHLFWGFWAIIQARHSVIDFDFLTFAEQRFDGYRSFKQRFF